MIKHPYLFTLFLFKSSIKPPRRAYLRQTHLRGAGGGLIENGGLFNLATKKKKTVSLLLKEPTRMQSGNALAQEVGGHAADDQKQIRTSSC